MDPDALVRMLDVTARQRAERRKDLQRLQKAADDYEDLKATLEALPAKVEHPILVPFGKMAFFPGSLRHGGKPITRGVRYIIAAFLFVDGWEEPAFWPTAT